MRIISLAWVALCLLAFGASAQVTVEIQLDEDQFLVGEGVEAAVRITNRSGREIEMGDTDNWLSFSVQSSEASNKIVAQLGDVPVKGAFTLPSSKRAVKRVNISPYFAIHAPGKYSLTAVVRIPAWGAEIESPPATFYMIEGTRIWEREVGLPDAESNGAPRVRRYLLQQANHLRGQPRLYLRVTDEPSQTLVKLHQVGVILSFSRPEPQVDSESRLHLLYQNGPASFGYTLYTPDGDLVKKQTWDFRGDSRPRLKLNERNEVAIVGGRRRLARADIPPSLDENAEPLEKPAVVTNAPPPALPPEPKRK